MRNRILVIRLGALGNVVLSFGPFAAIRRYHRGAEITLLTTAPYADWLAASPYFDSVWVDSRPAWWDGPRWWHLRRRLIAGGFDRIYDLQTSARSSRYYQLLPRPRPEWSGIAPGCSHPDRDPSRDRLHDVERQAGQLRQAGLLDVPPADLSWSVGDVTRFALPPTFALLVPGSSAHRPAKRWPAERYAALAAALAAHDLTPVVLGTIAERPLTQVIGQGAPIIDLTGQTDFGELATIARLAKLAIGNDTGPMHLLASVGCPSLVLFSDESDPALCAPRGPAVRVLRRSRLTDLPLQEVLTAAIGLIGQPVTVA